MCVIQKPTDGLWDEERWRQVIEARMGMHVEVHENGSALSEVRVL